MKIFNTILAFLTSFFKTKPKEIKDTFEFLPTAPDFDRDMKCLFSIITTAIENEKFKLKISGKRILNDDDLIDLSVLITTFVLESLSGQYTMIICRYIEKDKFPEFVTSIVVKNIVQLGLDTNKSMIQK